MVNNKDDTYCWSTTLKELDVVFSQLEDDRDDFEIDYQHVHEYDKLEYVSFLDRRSRTAFGTYWSQFRTAMFDLANRYLSSPEKDREMMRSIIVGLKQVRAYSLTLVDEQRWLLKSATDVDLLRRLLAIVSVATLGDDTAFATQFVLADLYHQAQSAGIDPDSVFVEVASISSDKLVQPANVSPRVFLASFQSLD